jgi:hypothetical protein
MLKKFSLLRCLAKDVHYVTTETGSLAILCLPHVSALKK